MTEKERFKEIMERMATTVELISDYAFKEAHKVELAETYAKEALSKLKNKQYENCEALLEMLLRDIK